MRLVFGPFGHKFDFLCLDDALLFVLREGVDVTYELLLVLLSSLHILVFGDLAHVLHVDGLLFLTDGQRMVRARVEVQRSPVLVGQRGFLVKLVPLLDLELLSP